MKSQRLHEKITGCFCVDHHQTHARDLERRSGLSRGRLLDAQAHPVGIDEHESIVSKLHLASSTSALVRETRFDRREHAHGNRHRDQRDLLTTVARAWGVGLGEVSQERARRAAIASVIQVPHRRRIEIDCALDEVHAESLRVEAPISRGVSRKRRHMMNAGDQRNHVEKASASPASFIVG